MKYMRCFALIFALLYLLAGCTATPQPNAPASTPSATATPTPTPTPAPTPHPWSETVTGLPFPDLVDYFVDVALHTEYNDNGATAKVLLSRWVQPIYYELSGPYTVHDQLVLNRLMDAMNQIEGFPGIYPADSEHTTNLTISFLSREEMNDRFLAQYGRCDGFAHYYWYNATRELYQADVTYCTDMDSSVRDSVICEELIQVLGLSNDSETYTDSIFYQYGSSVQWPAPYDWALLEMLYSPCLQLCMDETQVRQALGAIMLDASIT